MMESMGGQYIGARICIPSRGPDGWGEWGGCSWWRGKEGKMRGWATSRVEAVE